MLTARQSTITDFVVLALACQKLCLCCYGCRHEWLNIRTCTYMQALMKIRLFKIVRILSVSFPTKTTVRIRYI